MNAQPAEMVREMQDLCMEECGYHWLDRRGGETMAPEVVEEDFSAWGREDRISLARGTRLMLGVEPPCMRMTRRGGLDPLIDDGAGLGSVAEPVLRLDVDEDEVDRR